jgi:TonB family protein
VSITKTTYLAFLACLLCPFLLHAQGKAGYAAMLQKAADSEDLRSPGSPPFQLDANLLLTDGVGKKFPGTYRLLWSSPDQWREEIHLGPYTRIRVGAPGKYWQQRSTEFDLPHIFELSNMVDYTSLLRREAQSPNGKMKNRSNHGVKWDCVELQARKGLPDKEICLDSTDGTLMSEKMETAAVDPTELTSREYSDFAKFGEKVFPKTIRGMAGGTQLIDFSVTHLSPLDHTDASLFAAPPGAQPWARCESPDEKKSEFIQQPVPVYPEVSKSHHVQGTVLIYAVIGEDGVTRNLKVVSAPDKNLAESAITAVAGWRYVPRTCSGVPFAVEDIVNVIFTLSR